MSLSWCGLEVHGATAHVQLLRGPTSPVAPPKTGLALLFLFGSDPVARGGGYLLLSPGDKAAGPWSGTSELLWVVCRDPPSPLAKVNCQWRLDPAVQGLAQEMRRALLLPERPPLPFFDHLARAMVVAAFAAAQRRSQSAPRLPKPKLDRVLKAIEERLREPLSVQQLAAVAGLSRARFAAAFGATMGQTPMAYVRARRLEAVRSALEAGETDLTRLAARCGFSSHAHMTRAFGAAFGLTPSAYRARFPDVNRGEAASQPGGVSGRPAMANPAS